MAVRTVGEKALAACEREHVFKVPGVPKKKVLDEDTHTKNVEKIIVRDFYPDLPKLEAQAEYLDALERDDREKLRELHIKYGPKRPGSKPPTDIYSTPATFETPTPHSDGEKINKKGDSKDNPTHNPEPHSVKCTHDTDLSLDKYLAKNTSEDNASFTKILITNQEKHKQKHAWLYEKEETSKMDKEVQLALPSIEKQAIEGSSSMRPQIETWKYNAKNTLMYVPDGSNFSSKEKMEMKALKPKEITHSNTRFKAPVVNLPKSKSSMVQAMEHQAQLLQGKIGIDGKEVVGPSPKVNGYGFIGTPSPAPGVDESPLMTWGEIEGTPFRLDGSDTPVSHTPGPLFKIAEMPHRDRLAMKLAEDVGKAHRAKKQKALQQMSSLTTPSPKFGSLSRTERISWMSPAAQRLASSKLGIRTNTDKALRASYTPSPAHRQLEDKTPLSLTPSNTPKSNLIASKKWGNTPNMGITHSPRITQSPKVTSVKRDSMSSLTDNLLNLPKSVTLLKRTKSSLEDDQCDDAKRSKAADFF